jgi:uncharacterized membrane protein YccC
MASGLCLFAGWAMDDLGAGLTANLGAFVALYGSGRPYRNRARLLALVVCGLVFCVVAGLGAATVPNPWVSIALAALVAAFASFFCSSLNVGPPGAYMFMLACAAGTSMYGQASHLARIAILVAAGGLVSWVLHMLGALWRPRGPECQAVSNASRAIADFIDSAGHGQSDLRRHRAAASLHDAWRALIAWQPGRDRSDVKLGRLRARSRELHGLFAAAVREGSAGPSLDLEASAVIRNVEARVTDSPTEGAPAGLDERRSFFAAREMIATSLAWDARPPRIALRVGVAALLAGSIGALTGLERSYWAAAAAVLILHQGLNWVRAMQRGLERTFGTLLGLMLAAVLLWLYPRGVTLVGCIAVLQFAGQLFVGSNYAFAVFLFTPMALLIATAGSLSAPDVGALLVARGLDTMIGCAVGLAVLLATYRRDSVTVRNALSETLGAASFLLPYLARGEVTTAEARIARRRLRTDAFDLIQLYEEQAGGTERAREEADRIWPAVVAAHRLAFRILAACWEVEAAFSAGKARGPLLFGDGGEQGTVRALNSLQAGHLAEMPLSGSSFLVSEITALNESWPS